MGLKCGIIGLPNVGKSTLFKSLTNLKVSIKNYPFCTIKANHGIIQVPDIRLQKLSRLIKPKNIIPTSIEFVDIAGLISGASKGKGLGNKFLHDIRNTNAVIHVIRCFKNKDIIHIKDINPLEDIQVINAELILSDLEILEKFLKKNNVKENARNNIIKKIFCHLEKGIMIRKSSLNKKEILLIKDIIPLLITFKPQLYIANVDNFNFQENFLYQKFKQFSIKENIKEIPICALIESEIINFSLEEKKIFFNEFKQKKQFALEKIIQESYKLLNLHTFYTVGRKEVRAWEIPIGCSAIQAAKKIHSDFSRGFIFAETINYFNYIKNYPENVSKKSGKWRMEGKNYIINDADIIHFHFNI